MGVFDRFVQNETGEWTAQAHVNHAGAVVRSITDCGGDIGNCAVAVRIQHFKRHQFYARCNAGNAHAVVCQLCNGPGYVRSVSMIVIRVFVSLHKIVGTDELCFAQVFHAKTIFVVLISDSGVNHGNRDGCACRIIPCLRHADNVEVPLVLVVRIVGDGKR